MRSIRLAIGLLLGLSGGAFGQTAQPAASVPGSFGQAPYDPDIFNVRSFGAAGDGQTDDSASIASAAAAAVANSQRGQPSALYFPAGAYRLVRTLPTWTVPISVFGDGQERSVIRVDPAFSGDVFSWSEVWAANNYGTDTISPLTTQKAGVEVKGIGITGNRTSANVQNAFVFYDRADFIFMQDVGVFDLTGRALYSGVLRTKPVAYMRESHFNDLRFARCGSAGAAVVDFDSHGDGDTTNEISVDGLDIAAPGGVGLLLHSSTSKTGIRQMKFAGLHVDGQGGGGTAALVQVGDAAFAGNNNIDFVQTELINPPAGFAAIRFTAQSVATAPFQIRLQGRIGGEAAGGKGIVIDAGRDLSFDLTELHTRDVNVTVASSKTVRGPIVLDGHGQEAGWTRSIDPSSAANVERPVPHALQQF
jgi:Pectate lyase superfamily protein